MTVILMATDLGAASQRALRRAVALAEPLRARIHVVHAIHDEGNLAVARGALADHLRALGCGALFFDVVAGDAAEVVTATARSTGAVLTVMGQSEDGRLSAVLRGTTVDRVLRSTPCPVLVCKGAAPGPYRRIAVAFDGGAAATRTFIQAMRWQPQAAFSVVRVPWQGAPLLGPLVAAACREAGFVGQPDLHELAPGRVEPALFTALTGLAPDLVVLGTQGPGPAKTLFLGSVAAPLIETLPADVLVGR